eukprot:CAMPEP_0172615766 /NCGR_PEP_ID=MMETSP1068-20121228/62491_1 /TAXON_ID=35684 /ORGANISM="Pseudopedinella elastica, Strain CCMP716" /LENGTH=471 /DNA_ID=CAMNT_0013421013 /DNA_START=123 /DNA_END=1535 /DNA_ORIENTATION=+
MSSFGGDGGYRPGLGDRPGGWSGGAVVKRTNAPNGMEIGIDFPFVCEVCLGPNPYVRMVKGPPGGKLCHISGRPFQSFRWRAGPGGRWKECMVEATVAKDKNICQACLVDMTYGVPVGVRDALLEAGGADAGLGGGSELAPATSDPNSAFYWQQKDALAARSGQAGGSIQNLEPSRQLLHLARNIQSSESRQTTSWRNLPKLCSFWLGGTCSRVVQHKCPFRPCNGMFEFPEIAASHRELRLELIERLKKEGAVAVMRSLDPATKEAIQEAQKGNKEEAMRKRVSGEDDLTKRYLRKAREQMPALEAPKDEGITSLWVGGIEGGVVLEQDLRDAFYSYGEVRGIKMLPDKRCAFVDFVAREGAEAAAAKLHNNLQVKGLKLDIDWAKPQSLGGGKPKQLEAGGGGAAGAGAGGALAPYVPPGLAPGPPRGLQGHPGMDPAFQQRLMASVLPQGLPPPGFQGHYAPPPGGFP